jgi:N-methylhydantoinase B/oxoprolinase/acetone carboxylase alpha subunit
MGELKQRLHARIEARSKREPVPIVERPKDPVKWEVAYWRLLGIVAEGRELTRQISASPTVKEFGECVFALFSPIGESIGFSRGILLHMASMGSSIKWMIENDYEEDPGFHPGDIFYNNDPDIGGAHSADQAVLLPIFYEGELVAWAGGLTHCMEVGGTEPGGMPAAALSRYDDGQMVPCMLVGRNDKFDRTFHIMCDRNVRDGKWWVLDDRAKLAGAVKMKNGIIKLIDEIGVDYFKALSKEMVEEGRLAAQRKAKKVLFPGRYQTPTLYDTPNSDPAQRCRIPWDYIALAPLDMTIEDNGYITMDYDGATSPGFHSNNSSYSCTMGNHIYSMLQDIYYDGMYNEGMVDAFELNLPEDTVLNSGHEYACSAWLVAVQAVAGCLARTLGYSYYAAGFREEGMSGKAAQAARYAGGIDQFGNPFSVLVFEQAVSGGACNSQLDGLHVANAPWNPEVNMADCEMIELTWPIMWLGRRIQTDGHGYGRKRGGSPVSSLYVIEHDVKNIQSGGFGSTDKVVWWGAHGGYPAPARYNYALVDTDYKEKVDKQLPLPHGEGDDPHNIEFIKLLNGTVKEYPGQMASDMFERYDILHQTSGGSGGWGDPLSRIPQDVMNDLDLKFTSPYIAANVYGVVWDPKTMKVDEKATAAKRSEMKKQRLARSVPAQEFKEQQKIKVLAGKVPPVPKSSYNDSFTRSDKVLNLFREFYGLDENFTGFWEVK